MKQLYIILFLFQTLLSQETIHRGCIKENNNRSGIHREYQLENAYLSSSGHFLIHYDTNGSDAVDNTDEDNTGVADYVEAVAEIAESVRSTLTNTMGFKQEVPDEDGVYDIYIINQTSYGYCINDDDEHGTTWTDNNTTWIIDSCTDSEGNTIVDEEDNPINQNTCEADDFCIDDSGTTWIEYSEYCVDDNGNIIVDDGIQISEENCKADDFESTDAINEPQCESDDIQGDTYIEIDNNYIGDEFYTNGLNTMKATVAHEIFHAIQRAYIPDYNSSDKYFFEFTSMWIEDVIVPDANDYLYFLSGSNSKLFSNPELKFSDTDGYSTALFGHYLSSIVEGVDNETSNTIIREAWENFEGGLDPIESLDAVLLNYDFTFIEAWVDFCSRNFHNGQFSDTDNEIYYYTDQTSTVLETLDIETGYNIASQISNEESLEFDLDNQSIRLHSIQMDSDAFINVAYSDIPSFAKYITTEIDSPIVENAQIIDIYADINFQINNNNIVHFIYSDIDNNSIAAEITHQNIDCHGVLNGNAYLDGCGVCDEDPSNDCVDVIQIVSVYPNPIGRPGINSLNVIIDYGYYVDDANIAIYNIQGREVVSQNLGSKQGRIEEDFGLFLSSTLSSGIYFIHLECDNVVVRQKFTILK